MSGRQHRSLFISVLFFVSFVFSFFGLAHGAEGPLPAAASSMSPQQIQQMIQNASGSSAPQDIQTVPTFETIEVSGDTGAEQVEAAGQEITTVKKDTFSSTEQLYRQQYNSPLAHSLQQYGYNLFDSATNALSKLAIPSDDYVIGPGDKLRIRIWGNGKDAAYTGTVSRDGTIDAPQIGIVPISGTSFGKLEEIFRKEAEKYVQGFNISVTLVELRSVEIYVVGEVRRPGLHLVPPFSTVLSGLIAGDGVKKSGSLRTIRVLRDGKLIQVVDLYSLLLRGSRQGDISLQDGDVLFVPRLGPTAAIAGATIQPAIYELTTEKTVADLLALAGGALPQTFTEKLLLRRFVNNQEFVIQDIDRRADKTDLSQIAIENGDLLELQYLGATWPEVVRLEGNVWFPDVFNFRAGLKLSDILVGPALLKPDSVVDFALLHRYNSQTTEYQIERFSLADVFAKKYDTLLNVYDRVEILSRKAFNSPIQLTEGVWRPGVIHLTGNVWFPDSYPYQPGLKLSEILTGADMLKPESILDFGLVYHYDEKTTLYNVERFPLSDLLNHQFDLVLRPFDRVEILSKESFNIEEPIKISGAVWKGGEYRYTPGLTLADLCGLAGGFRFSADQQRIDLSRQKIENGVATVTHQILSIAENGNYLLQPYDFVNVRSVKDATSFNSAQITGEVKYPGDYRIKDGERLSDLIERAGGFTENAYFYGAYFTSQRAREIQQASINKMIDDLEVRVQTVLADQAQLMSGSNDENLISGQQVALQKLISRLRQVKATGRMGITLGPLASLKDTAFDFEIHDGASLHIPQRPNFVSVVGSVFSPNSFLYMNGMDLDDYLAKAGGPTKTADDESIYIVKANGEILAATQHQGLFKKFGNSQLMPGDTIVVPEDIERVPYMKLVRDVSDIIFKIATTAGIIFAI